MFYIGASPLSHFHERFVFIEKCYLYNYVNDNFLNSPSKYLTGFLNHLTYNGNNGIEWFDKNVMQASRNNWHFTLFSPRSTERQLWWLCNGTPLLSVTEVTVLGLSLYDTICFSQHTSACCKKSTMQLNAFEPISKHLYMKLSRTIYNAFIMSNLHYCSLV